jgi:hypothetical protein
MPILPDIVTPSELAKRLGWSERRVRSVARELGACRILGNRMRLTKEDVEAILEATKPKPLGPPTRVKDLFRSPAVRIPEVTYDDLVRMREAKKRRKEAEKANRPRLRRVKLPRFKPKDEG